MSPQAVKPEFPHISTMDDTMQKPFVLALQAVVNGVYRMSPVVPGLVEASSNLSLISLGDGHAEWSGLQRSSVESSKTDVARTFAAPFQLIGAKVVHDAGYPGWSPSAESPILDKMKTLYRELFGHDVKVSACHAGLECGVIAITYPDLDMISFGPNIHEAHSEKECCSISSVQKVNSERFSNVWHKGVSRSHDYQPNEASGAGGEGVGDVVAVHGDGSADSFGGPGAGEGGGGFDAEVGGWGNGSASHMPHR